MSHNANDNPLTPEQQAMLDELGGQCRSLDKELQIWDRIARAPETIDEVERELNLQRFQNEEKLKELL